MKGVDLGRARGPVDSCAVGDALLQELTLHTAHRIVHHGTSFAVDSDAPALTIAREDDKRADVRRVLHPRPMIARAVPRLCERDQSRVHRRGLEAVAVVAALPAVLVAQHGLRCADPAAHRLLVPSGDHRRWMQIQVASQLAVFDARAQQKRRRLEGTGAHNDRSRVHPHGEACARLFVAPDSLHPRHSTAIETQMIGSARRHDRRAPRELCVAQIRV